MPCNPTRFAETTSAFWNWKCKAILEIVSAGIIRAMLLSARRFCNLLYVDGTGPVRLEGAQPLQQSLGLMAAMDAH
jgi:hypothetical protein